MNVPPTLRTVGAAFLSWIAFPSVTIKLPWLGKWASRKSPINDRKTTGAKTGGRRDEAGSRAGASMRRGVVGGVVPKNGIVHHVIL